MDKLFKDTDSLSELDLSHWSTTSIQYLSRMFQGAQNLTRLNLSNWNTQNVIEMHEMFGDTVSLRILTLSPFFEFKVSWIDAGIPTITTTNNFTGYWQNIGYGTINNPKGSFILTSEELMEQYNGATMADTYVWQPQPFMVHELKIGNFEGKINQEDNNITFYAPPHLLNNGELRGQITELDAAENTLKFFVANQEWPLTLGQTAGFYHGDLIYVDLERTYTVTIAMPQLGFINEMAINGYEAIIDQENAIVTFTVPSHLVIDSVFSGTLTNFEADDETLIFYVGNTEWPLIQGQSAGISTGNLVYISNGKVYTIVIA